MRALSGAIITAASLLGLGLVSLGMGFRYAKSDEQWLYFKQMDNPFIYLTVLLSITLAIGLGITFIGLAFHHHRRHHELFGDTEEHKTRHGRAAQ
jgi:cytochrome bd-type quinol oxidase subunit 2